MPSPYYNLSELKSLVFDDMDFLKQIVDVFINQMPVDCAELKNATIHQQWKEVSLKAHKIKSSVKTIGIHDIYDDILQIESNSQAGVKLDAIPQQVDDFIAKVNLIISDLKQESFNL